MIKSTYKVPEMDCPCEESLIRVKLRSIEGISELIFDIDGRTLSILHSTDEAEITAALEPLGLGATLINTEKL